MPSTPARRPLTVLQVIPALDTGGAERTTVDIAAALAARGDRALVASAGGRMEGELAAAGAKLVRLDVATKNPAAMAANALALARLVGRERVDLVHARSRAPAWSALLACRLTGAPFVTTYHGAYGESGGLKRIYNSVMTRGDVVIANSDFTSRLIAERHGTEVNSIAVIPRGVDLAGFRPEAVSEERRAALRHAWRLAPADRVVLNLARLTPWKGQRLLIEAASLPPLARRDKLVFIIAGDEQGRSAYRAELAARIAAAGLSGRVRVVGHCDDTPAALALADVAVVASIEPEAFGRAALEAQAMRVPVVATGIGAAPETVRAPPAAEPAERTGWLVPPGDASGLAAAIAAALELTADERLALGVRARAQAERFSVAAMASATLAVYDRLASKAERPDFRAA